MSSSLRYFNKRNALNAATQSAATTNFNHLRSIPRAWLIRRSKHDPKLKSVRVADRIKWWNIVPGDQIRLRGDKDNTIHEVLSINRLSNRVFLKNTAEDTGSETAPPKSKNFHYSRCQLYVGEFKLRPKKDPTGPLEDQHVFASRISTSQPYWDYNQHRWVWRRYAVTTVPRLPWLGRGMKIRIPWPSMPKRRYPDAGIYDTTAQEVAKVTYQLPLFDPSPLAPLPRVPEEDEYLRHVFNPHLSLGYDASAPFELYLQPDLANPHSRAKKLERWKAHQSALHALRKKIADHELQHLDGRTVKQAKADAAFKWREQVEAEQKKKKKARWMHSAQVAKWARKAEKRSKKEARQRRRLTELTLKEEPNQVLSMASSLGSPEALYRAIPQGEDVNASQINLGSEAVISSEEPTDPPAFLVDSSIHWVHLILGCAVLLSWNVVITAMPFFASRLAQSSLRSTFASYLTTTFTAANLIVLAHATATSKHTIPSRRTRSAIAWLILLNFLLSLTTFFTPSPGIFFAFILFNGAAQATAGAYLQTSVIAVASLFGPRAVQSVMSGQAAVAVAVSGVQVISAYASVHGKPRTFVGDGSAEERSARWFFSLSTLFLLFSLVAHTWMVRTPIYQHVAASLETERKVQGDAGHDEERRGLVSGHAHTSSLSSDRANSIRVAKLNVIYEIAVAYVFVVTLAVFPPITTSIRPTNPAIHPLLFSAVHFLVFNVGDFLGRYLCSFPIFLIWSARRLLTLSLARTLFIPVFLMCNIQRGTTVVHRDPVISSDLLFMLILFSFGLSNGYISSLCMMSAPSLEHNPRLKGKPEDVDVAATVASFCLVGGLTAGSIGSFAVKAAFCGCNPFID
ncbi:hypothetical protein CVT26_000828 [Gymnopilus dilepis]|uniref:Nucleoside transporter n=1 Tax=Gymnopilus dilepis TaxID=231916 RepID=A0A409YLC0_9AGAR|nr:hypothetical protein CVT26_000828 [Gymnopilus dilepis]